MLALVLYFVEGRHVSSSDEIGRLVLLFSHCSSSISYDPLSGVLSDVLSYVLKHGKGASAQVATEQKKVEQEEAEPKPKPLLRKKTSRGGRTFTNQLVFVKCFQFLKALATKNLEVQQR